MPENCRSAKFATHSGADATLVTGTIYVGAHPDLEARVLWFRLGDQLYPTVYTLWQNPRLIPLLHTPSMVIEKLRAGADLMVPGLARGPPFPEKAKKGAMVAVASMDYPSVPLFVGVCEIDVSALEKVQGVKGHAVRGLHWEGDELWAWASNNTGGESAPEEVLGWDQQSPDDMSNPIVKGVSEMALDEDQEEGGVSLDAQDDEAPSKEEEEPPSTAQIDEAFEKAFLYALYDARKKGSAPGYGIEVPMLPSFLIANLINPYLPVLSPSQAQHYTMKKTSWKNSKKFIKHLDKKNLVKSKDRSGGETVIVDIDFDDQTILTFTPYRLPKAETASGDGQLDSALHQNLRIQILIRASHKLVPTLLASKTAFYSPQQVTDSIRNYIDANPSLTVGTSSPRFLKLDPFLTSLLSPTHAPDARPLSTGEIARDVLLRRIVDDSHLCQKFWILLHGSQRYKSENPDPAFPKPRAGDPPKVSITIENRTGSKLVTKVARLEAFSIIPDILAADLRKECASSTSVGQLMGGKPGLKEVLVQGDQRAAVEKELARRGVRSDWIEVLDKGGKGKSKRPAGKR